MTEPLPPQQPPDSAIADPFVREGTTRFGAWSRYEDVAIHFNDLLMRWRIQAIGGVMTLVTLSGFVVGNANDANARYRAMLILASTLLLAWFGAALIDLFYYRKLLEGAVAAIRRIERESQVIRLSTVIDEYALWGGKWAPIAFYIFGGLPLLAIALWAIYQLRHIT